MKKILIIQTSFIGDVILATSLVETMALQCPGSELHFLVRKGNEGVLENNPHLAKVLVWDKKNHKLKDLVSILSQVRKEHYTYVFNLQRFFLTGLLSVFSKAGQTIGFDKNPWSLFFSKKVKHRIGTAETPIHEVERNAALIADLTNGKWALPKIYPKSKPDQLIGHHSPYITISPASVWFTKQWPGEKWAAFMDKVKPEITIYMLGGPSEKNACEKIKSLTRHPNVLVVAGQFSLLESAAIMAGAAMNYTNDSAPLHLASAVNAPVTALFCSTLPSFGFGPLSDDSCILETPYLLECRPCGQHGRSACPKGHFRCAEIPEEHLLDRLR